MATFNTFNKEKLELNGPENVMRLEGKINGIKKVIYLFMDTNTEVCHQTECNNIYSQDINQYFAKEFMKLDGTDKIIDIFAFTSDYIKIVTNSQSSDFKAPPRRSIRRLKYSDSIIQLLASTLESKRSKKSKMFQNIRVHNPDITKDIIYRVEPIFNNIMGYTFNISRYYQNFNYLIESFTEVQKQLYHFYELYEITAGEKATKSSASQSHHHFKTDHFTSKYISVSNKPSRVVKNSNNSLQSSIERLPDFETAVRKVLFEYKHKNVKNILSDIFRNKMAQMFDFISDLDKMIQMFQSMQTLLDNPQFSLDQGYHVYFSLVANQRLTIFRDTYISSLMAYNYYSSISRWILVCYILRRFLDKDYVTTLVCNIGSMTSSIIVEILVEHFGFKITHVSKPNDMSIKDINQQVKEHIKNNISLDAIFSSKHEDMQCSDITNFPKNFD